MLKRHILALLLAAGVFDAAAAVRLSPEIALSPVGAPAVSRGSRPRVASNGRDFLVLWRDEASVTYARAFDSNGVAKSPYATRVSSTIRSMEIVSDGSGYMLVYWNTVNLYSQRLDENGALTGAAELLATGSPKAAIAILVAFNGSHYLVYGEGTGTQLLDHNGARTGTTYTFTNPVWLGARGADFQVIDKREACESAGCSTRYDLTTITSTQLTTSLISESEGRGVFASAAATDDAIAVVDARNIRVFGRDGSLRGAHALPLGFTPARLHAAWDGQQFLAFVSGTAGVYVVRVSRQGTLGATTRFPRTPDAFDDTVRVASNGAQELIVWRERAIVGRVVPNFNAMDEREPDALSVAPDAKILPQIAARGANEIVAWIDQRTVTIEGTANGVPFTIAPLGRFEGRPAVVAGDNMFLVAWYERAPIWGGYLVASRVAFDGRVLDRRSIRLLWQSYSSSRPAVAFGNGEFLFAVHDKGEFTGSVHFVRMPENGEPRLVRTIEATRVTGDILAPSVTWTGSEFVSAYLICCDYPSPEKAFASLEFVRASAGDPVQVFAFQTENAGTFGFAHGAGRATAVVPHDGLTAVQRELATKEITGWSEPEMPNVHPANVELVWDGAEYVAAWVEPVSGEYRVRALRLNASAQPLDETPIEIGIASSARAVAERRLGRREDRVRADGSRQPRRVARFRAHDRARVRGGRVAVARDPLAQDLHVAPRARLHFERRLVLAGEAGHAHALSALERARVDVRRGVDEDLHRAAAVVDVDLVSVRKIGGDLGDRALDGDDVSEGCSADGAGGDA
jgi:hypothetical protein